MNTAKKVLLVDDELMAMQERLKENLNRKEVELTMAVDYNGALEKINLAKFDLIIIDVGLLGDKNGIALVKKIRETDSQTKIHVLTGYGEKYEQEAYDAGADRYIQQPLSLAKHVYKGLGIK